MQILELIVEPGREEHIAAHHVSVAEVEEVVFGRPHISQTRDERYRFLGQTEAGRYLAVFLGPRGHGVYGLITARDAPDSERRLYQARKKL